MNKVSIAVDYRDILEKDPNSEWGPCNYSKGFAFAVIDENLNWGTPTGTFPTVWHAQAAAEDHARSLRPTLGYTPKVYNETF